MKELILSHYEVRNFSNELLFEDPCYSICNSYIINNCLQGLRPRPVYIKD